MKLLCKVLTIGIIFMGMLSVAHAQHYDLVINNGRVMDPETMYDGIANVGIKDGRIAVITKKQIKGKETIDAKGLKEGALGIGSTLGDMRDGVSAREFFEVQKKDQDINNITPNQ